MGVVIHEVGEDNRPLQVWVDRMYETYTRAFVHAFVDNNEIHLTAPAEYYVWELVLKLIHTFIKSN